MPLYEYECDVCTHRFERQQRFSDPPVANCPECNGSLHKVFHPANVIFKGSGWYVTDNRTDNGKNEKNGSPPNPRRLPQRTPPSPRPRALPKRMPAESPSRRPQRRIQRSRPARAPRTRARTSSLLQLAKMVVRNRWNILYRGGVHASLVGGDEAAAN